MEKSIDQEYHSLIEDFEKYLDIPKLRDKAFRNFHKKLSKVALSLPGYNGAFLDNVLSRQFYIRHYF
jgi:hypothetical protein